MLFVTGPRFRRLLVLFVVGAVIVRVIRQLRGDPTRAFDQSTAPAPIPAPVPPSTASAGWAAPVDGNCPVGHPVKANLRSGIFHMPGMSAYDRTNADRCYADPEHAVADGLRVAKR